MAKSEYRDHSFVFLSVRLLWPLVCRVANRYSVLTSCQTGPMDRWACRVANDSRPQPITHTQAPTQTNEQESYRAERASPGSWSLDTPLYQPSAQERWCCHCLLWYCLLLFVIVILVEGHVFGAESGVEREREGVRGIIAAAAHRGVCKCSRLMKC